MLSDEEVRDRLLSALVETLAFHGFDRACEMDALDMAYALIDRCPEPDGPGLGVTARRIASDAARAADGRARALSEKIDRCTVHMRALLGYAEDQPDAGLEALVVQAKGNARAAERALVERQVAEIDKASQKRFHGKNFKRVWASGGRTGMNVAAAIVRAALRPEAATTEGAEECFKWASPETCVTKGDEARCDKCKERKPRAVPASVHPDTEGERAQCQAEWSPVAGGPGYRCTKAAHHWGLHDSARAARGEGADS